MSYLGRLPPDLLRKRYAQMHRLLQAAETTRIKLEERIKMLEAENHYLRMERDSPKEEGSVYR